MGIDAYKEPIMRFDGTTERERELANKEIAERRNAEAEMTYRFANLHMPADIRERARSWGMEAWAEVLWNNAFQAGYREAMRDRAALRAKEGRE